MMKHQYLYVILLPTVQKEQRVVCAWAPNMTRKTPNPPPLTPAPPTALLPVSPDRTFAHRLSSHSPNPRSCVSLSPTRPLVCILNPPLSPTITATALVQAYLTDHLD